MDANALRLEIIHRACQLPAENLPQALAALERLNQVSQPQVADVGSYDWPHAPLHRLSEKGTYMVTTATQGKLHLFRDADRLDLLQSAVLTLAPKYDWHLEAWALFSNHYHFVGYTLASPSRLKELLADLHASTARDLNRLDGEPGRQVWHNFWDKQLTYEKSYLARLNYVHQNAVKHGLVRVANQYPWCSAAWFERTARPAQVKTIYGFKIDGVKVTDDFEPLVIAR